jgi:hypothetical protein
MSNELIITIRMQILTRIKNIYYSINYIIYYIITFIVQKIIIHQVFFFFANY